MLATALAMTTVLGCASACSSGGEPHAAPVTSHELVTSGPGTGDLFLHGTVRRGKQPVSGVRIDVLLWPADRDSKIGTTEYAWDKRATTDAAGHWAVRMDPDTLPSKYFPASDDLLNFEIEVLDGKRFGMSANTLYLLKRTRVWRSEDSRPGDPVMEVSIDEAANEIVFIDSHGDKHRWRHFFV